MVEMTGVEPVSKIPFLKNFYRLRKVPNIRFININFS
nr:MAG TPA: hypothetical protein [Caudoviricetes sp.]